MTSCTDKHGAATRAAAQKAFEAINAAHSTLSDPLRRRRYDEDLAFGDGIFRGAPSYASAPRRVLRVEVPCQLEVLGGWVQAEVDLSAALGRPAHRQHVHRLFVPPGSADGAAVRCSVGSFDVEVLLRELPHARYLRLGDRLLVTRWLPAWHNWRRSRVCVRTICGMRVRVCERGERVRPGETRRVAGAGMPVPGGGDRPWTSPRGELMVEMRLRSVGESALRTAALGVLGAAGAWVSGGLLRRLSRLAAPRARKRRMVPWAGRGRPIRVIGSGTAMWFTESSD